jgi:hypothetical protein
VSHRPIHQCSTRPSIFNIKTFACKRKTHRSEDKGQCHLRKWFLDIRILHAFILLIAKPLLIHDFLDDRVMVKTLVSRGQTFLTMRPELWEDWAGK